MPFAFYKNTIFVYLQAPRNTFDSQQYLIPSHCPHIWCPFLFISFSSPLFLSILLSLLVSYILSSCFFEVLCFPHFRLLVVHIILVKIVNFQSPFCWKIMMLQFRVENEHFPFIYFHHKIWMFSQFDSLTPLNFNSDVFSKHIDAKSLWPSHLQYLKNTHLLNLYNTQHFPSRN